MSFIEMGKNSNLICSRIYNDYIRVSVHTKKRTLEILIEADVKSEMVDIQSLIFNKNVYDKGPNIVVIGGGTGLNTVYKE